MCWTHLTLAQLRGSSPFAFTPRWIILLQRVGFCIFPIFLAFKQHFIISLYSCILFRNKDMNGKEGLNPRGSVCGMSKDTYSGEPLIWAGLELSGWALKRHSSIEKGYQTFYDHVLINCQRMYQNVSNCNYCEILKEGWAWTYITMILPYSSIRGESLTDLSVST